MVNSFDPQPIQNYNQTPPPDDGSETSDNLITWDKIKTKLTDTIKTAYDKLMVELSLVFEDVPLLADTISELKGVAVGAISSETVYVRGHTSIGDGGGGTFIWNAASSEPDNGGTIIEPSTPQPTGRWVRQYAGPLNLAWFGILEGDVDANATINSTAMTNALAAVNDPDLQKQGGFITIPRGTYIFNAITIGIGSANGHIKLQGEGIQTILKCANGVNADFLTIDADYCALRDLQIDGNKNGQTAGSAVRLGSNNFFVDITSCRIRNGKEYGILATGGNVGVLINCGVFSSGKGIRITNWLEFNMHTSTVEDNQSGGMEIVGSPNRTIVNLHGCYLEDNDTLGTGAPHMDLQTLREVHKVSVEGCFFNETGNSPTQTAIKISGGHNMVDNLKFRHNLFSNLAASWDLSGITATNVGLNDIRFNTYDGVDGPAPAYGFLNDESRKIDFYSDEISLTGGASTVPFTVAQGMRPIRLDKVVEHTVTSPPADTTGNTLRIGYDGSSSAFMNVNATASAAVNALTDRTGDLSTTATSSTDRVLTYGKSGGGLASGSVRLQITGWVF